jgi:OOP family OmpA-OmpF porin
MKFKLLAGAALAAVFAATGAAAQVGWYGAVDLGYHWPETMKMTSSANNPATGAPYRWNFKQQDDWVGFGRLGYQLTDHWRVEGELGYRPGDVKSAGLRGQAVHRLLPVRSVHPDAGSPGGGPRGCPVRR